MQKKLIVLAIAGLASTAAFAQSNVTIYGIMDASVDLIDIGDDVAPTASSGRNEMQINSNSSRIGFKGSEDLGNGLKAVFQIETGIGADGTAVTSNNSRNTYVGLAGGFGSVLLGQYDTPYKTATRKFDAFADHLGDNRNLMGAGYTGFDIRRANSVIYQSPDFNGFAFAGAYSATGEGANATGGTTKDKILSLNGTYTSGPWYGALAWQKNDFGSGTAAGASGTVGDEEKAWKLGVGYTEGAINVGFAYEDVNSDTAIAAADIDHKAWTLNGSYTMGSNVFKAAYTSMGDIANVGDTGAKQWALGYEHIMSKRTKLYAEYVKLSNETAGGFMLNGAATTAIVGGPVSTGDFNQSALSLGMRHSF